MNPASSPRSLVETGLAPSPQTASRSSGPRVRARRNLHPQAPLSCGKVCGCEGPTPEFSGTDRLVGMSQRRLGVSKAMFLSWLTLAWMARVRTAYESALSSQKVRFAHKPKRCNPHHQWLTLPWRSWRPCKNAEKSALYTHGMILFTPLYSRRNSPTHCPRPP